MTREITKEIYYIWMVIQGKSKPVVFRSSLEIQDIRCEIEPNIHVSRQMDIAFHIQ